MSENSGYGLKHVFGLVVAVAAMAAIVWAWQDGLRLLNGTIFVELRYFLFAGFVVAFLTAVNRLTDWFFH